MESGRRKNPDWIWCSSFIWWHKKDREARTSDIALVYCGNAFIIFLDNDEQDGWFDELHKDVIAPYTLDA